jgi:hypothetical protein
MSTHLTARRHAPHPLSAVARDTFGADEGGVRLGLVIQIRRQLELGLYDEDARIDATIDRLVADLK